MSIYEKLIALQGELKAPKGNYNSFGKYKYRSCEDILEAVKPLLKKYGLALILTDDVLECGGRIYIKATASLTDTEGGTRIGNTAFARESAEKKGMDDSQVTGTASSYARKYALNGLFLIDDTKDADTDEYKRQTQAVGRAIEMLGTGSDEQMASAEEVANAVNTQQIGKVKALALIARCEEAGIDPKEVAKLYKVSTLEALTERQHENIHANWSKVVEKCRPQAS